MPLEPVTLRCTVDRDLFFKGEQLTFKCKWMSLFVTYIGLRIAGGYRGELCFNSKKPEEKLDEEHGLYRIKCSPTYGEIIIFSSSKKEDPKLKIWNDQIYVDDILISKDKIVESLKYFALNGIVILTHRPIQLSLFDEIQDTSIDQSPKQSIFLN